MVPEDAALASPRRRRQRAVRDGPDPRDHAAAVPARGAGVDGPCDDGARGNRYNGPWRTDLPTETPADRLRAALDLFDEGGALMHQNLRRRHPEESEEQIQARLQAWLLERLGAEGGDGWGRSRPGRDAER
ncbi:MAG: hypothetical protein ACQEXJ_19190 [Myxococcota bacterium]